MAHDAHGPHELVAQQTPSTHAPEAQSDGRVHDAPFMRGAAQRPPWHRFGATQSASTAHAVRQAPAAHKKGAHDCCGPGRQVPAPSQVEGCVDVAGPVHVGAVQTTPAA